jgi:hypothetical protein
MPVDQNQQGGRRPHYHRGRRGPDRRGADRRTPQPQEPPARPGDQVDVEQIMRDIRARISQRHGIELSTQQIQELAARRLEAILDPRTVNPSLMQQLRRGAAATPEVAPPATDPGYSFEATTLYDSHRGLLRFIRRLLNPILKLFFNPTPLIQALHTQSRLNREAAAREAERDRLQLEWNALHYEIVQRLVTEVSRVSVEMQALGLRIESLTARVDFNDRRVRSMEAGAPQQQSRPQQSRPAEQQSRAAEQISPAPAASVEPGAAGASPAEGASAEVARRRRRRRRGRRGGAGAVETTAPTVVVGGSEGLAGPDAADLNDGESDEGDFEDAAAPLVEDARPTGRDAMEPAPASTVAPSEVAMTPAPAPPGTPDTVSQPPEQLAPPPDEPAPPPPEPDPGPPDR